MKNKGYVPLDWLDGYKPSKRDKALQFLNRTIDMDPNSLAPMYTPNDLVMLYALVGSVSDKIAEEFHDTNDIDRYHKFVLPMINKILEDYPDIHPITNDHGVITRYV